MPSRMAVADRELSIPSSARPLTPAPKPRTARPPAISSRVAMAIAVSAGWREYGSVTQGPSRTRRVDCAKTVRVA